MTAGTGTYARAARRLGFSRLLLVAAGMAVVAATAIGPLADGDPSGPHVAPLVIAAVLFVSTLLPRIVRINLVVFLALVVTMETAVRLFTPDSPRLQVTYVDEAGRALPESEHSYGIADARMGYALRPSLHVRARQMLGTSELATMTLTIDRLGRRTDGRPADVRQKFVAFFGNSNTFGMWVDDDSTFVHHVGAALPTTRVYNYGVPGYGPQHMLAKIERSEMREELPEGRGIAVYLFIDDHVRRAANAMRVDWLHRSPMYEIDASGALVSAGSLASAHPLLHSLYHDVLLKSRLLAALGIDPPRIGHYHVALTCRIIAEARQRWKAQFPESDLYVAIFPSERSHSPAIGECLRRTRVEVWDFSAMPWPDELAIPQDRHPNALGHRVLAALLSPRVSAALSAVAPNAHDVERHSRGPKDLSRD